MNDYTTQDLAAILNNGGQLPQFSSAQDALDFANAVVQNQQLFSVAGNSSPVQWAQYILNIPNVAVANTAAYNNGPTNQSAATSAATMAQVLQTANANPATIVDGGWTRAAQLYPQNVAALQSKYDNLESNVKNSTANGSPIPANLQQQLNQLAPSLQAAGISSDNIQQDANGNWVPTSYVTANQAAQANSQTGSTITTAGTNTGGTNGGQQTPMQQILNPADMAQYKPSDYQRLADGTVVLNPGVTPIAGTTKTYAGTAQGGTSTTTGGTQTPPTGSGATGTNGSTTGTTGTGTGTGTGTTSPLNSGSTAAGFNAQGQVTNPSFWMSYFTSQGMNPPAGMTDAQVLQAAATWNQMQKNASTFSDVVPQQLTSAQAAQFLAQAQSTIDPSFQQAAALANQTFLQNYQQTTGDFSAQQQQDATTFNQNQQALAQQYAQNGTALSSMRTNAQNALNQQDQGVVGSQRRQLQSSLQSLGNQYEQTYGTAALQQLQGQINPVNAQGYSQLGIGAQNYGITPVGGILGTNQAAQTTAEIQQQQQLEQAAIQSNYQKVFGSIPGYNSSTSSSS